MILNPARKRFSVKRMDNKKKVKAENFNTIMQRVMRQNKRALDSLSKL